MELMHLFGAAFLIAIIFFARWVYVTIDAYEEENRSEEDGPRDL